MHIRDAQTTDAAEIAAVIHSIIEIRSVAKDSVETTASTVRSNLVRVREDRTSDAYVVEGDAGVIVGYGVVHWVPFLFLPGGEAYITELFIRPADTGRKLGSTLMAHMVAEAKRRDVHAYRCSMGGMVRLIIGSFIENLVG